MDDHGEAAGVAPVRSLQPGDVVLTKASRGAALEVVALDLVEHGALVRDGRRETEDDR